MRDDAAALLAKGAPAGAGEPGRPTRSTRSACSTSPTWQPTTGRAPLEVAELYYALSEHIGLDRILASVSALDRGDRWHALARQAVRDGLYASVRAITADVLTTTDPDQPAGGQDRPVGGARTGSGSSGPGSRWARSPGPGSATSPRSRWPPGRSGRWPADRPCARRGRPGWQNAVGVAGRAQQGAAGALKGERPPMGDAQRYVTDVRVRYSDLDAQGHVNNARVLTLLEEARVDWLYRTRRGTAPTSWSGRMVVASLEIQYKRPITVRPAGPGVARGRPRSATRRSPSTTS